MRSVIGTNPVTRAAAAFLVGGLAVLVVHQPVVGLLHALGSTPIYAVQSASHTAVGHPGVPVIDLLGRHLDDPDRLDTGSPAARMGLLDWCSLSGRTAADIDDLVRHFSAKGALAEQRRCIGRRRRRADRQRHLGSRFCVCMVSNICCSSIDGRDSDRAPAHPCLKILNVIAIRQSRPRPRRNRAEAKESHCRPFGCRPREGDR
jgi:hypothetical protein